MLDPDQRITGKGVLKLRKANITVDLFPPEMMSQLEEMNRGFTRDRVAANETSIPPGVTEAGITAFYPSRDFYGKLRADASTIDKYISTATKSVVMVSINLATGITAHDVCDALRQKLENSRFTAVISLLNPDQADAVSVMARILNTTPQTLAGSIRESLVSMTKFRSTLSASAASRLSILKHTSLPQASAILLDHRTRYGRIQLETKPHKVGLQRSYAFEVGRAKRGELYEVLVSAYETILQEANPILDGAES
jgi:hypothetical protein